MIHDFVYFSLTILIANSTQIAEYFFYLVPIGSVADPYHFDTEPDPGSEKIRFGSGANFDTDQNPGKNDTDPDSAKKD